MNRQPPPWRKIVVEELQLLSSEREQLDYESKVPNVDITAELVSGWFDDSYHPDDPQFKGCFSSNELAALAKFSALFNERRKVLPKSNGTVRSWLTDESWREVMNEAASALAEVAA
jgi:hypothetical protein